MMFFSKYLPTEIPNLNFCLRLYGGLIRFFMSIQIKLHYVTFFQLCLLWYGVLGDACQYDIDFTIADIGGKPALGQQQGKDTSDLLQTAGTAWFMMHIFGGMIRSMVYIEPYYDIPDDPEIPEWRTLLFNRCGP